MIRKLLAQVSLVALFAVPANAQAVDVRVDAQASAKPQALKRAYAPVCAQGVKVYDDIKEVPKPYDSLTVPAPGEPVMVTNEAEAEAAALAMRGRAGSVGATGVVVTDETQDDGAGNVRMRRSVQGVFVSADSARAQKACK